MRWSTGVANRRLLVTALLVQALAVCAAAWLGMGAGRAGGDAAGAAGRTGLTTGFTRLRDDPLLRVAVGGLGVAVLASIVVNVAEVFFVLEDLGAVGIGVGLLLTGAVASLLTLMIGWLVGGAANAVQRVAITALVRARTPDAARGRVFAAMAASLQTFNVVGLLVSGAVVAAVGARAGLVVSGVVTVAVAVVTWMLSRSAPHTAAAPSPSGAAT